MHALMAREGDNGSSLTMVPPTAEPGLIPGGENKAPASSFRNVVLKSVLLNVVIVMTSFPVLVHFGGPRAVVPTLALMAAISVLIWTATFTVFSCVAIGRVLWTTFASGTRRKPRVSAKRDGVADRWLDGPG